jgi:anti-sigma factor RsiW
MNLEQELKIQAFIDRELPPQEALDMADWIENDAEAKRLHDELKQTCALTVRNEAPRVIPCSPEFFWSQIERRIQAQPAAKARASIELGWIWRLLAPASALMLMAILMFPQPHEVRSEVAFVAGPEVETAIHDANVITFRSDSEGISVVWIDMD